MAARPNQARIIAHLDHVLGEFMHGYILTGFIQGLDKPTRIMRATSPEMSIALQVINGSPLQVTPSGEPPVSEP